MNLYFYFLWRFFAYFAIPSCISGAYTLATP